MFICNVSLYTEDALKEVNLVRHTTSTPSISSTTPASYASLEQTTHAYSHILPSNRDMSYGHHQGMPYQGNPGMNPYEMQTSPYHGMLPLIRRHSTASANNKTSWLCKRQPLRRPRSLALSIQPTTSTPARALRRPTRSLRPPNSVWRHARWCRRTSAAQDVGQQYWWSERTAASGHVHEKPDWKPGVQRLQADRYER